jgi:hypothetical protein
MEGEMTDLLFKSKKARWFALMGLMGVFEIINLTIGKKILELPLYELLFVIPMAASFVGQAVAWMPIFEWLRDGLGLAKVHKHDSGLGETTEPICDDGLWSAIGALITCPLCAGMWAGAILTTLRIYFPELGVPMLYTIAAGGTAAMFTHFAGMMEWRKAESWERAARDRRSREKAESIVESETSQLQMPLWITKE